MWFDEQPPPDWSIELPPGLDLLNSNQRLHPMVKAQMTKRLRRAGYRASMEIGLPRLERVYVVGELRPNDRRRRDPGNWYPSAKAAVDGAMTDAGVLVDDDAEHLVGPDMRLGRVVKGGQLVLHIWRGTDT
ncbi:hypothetical protein GBF35_25880 [Nonomuraea phyllanthi]|uniref:hypothetical protein n=1 Tax=Nonomuraea phyllanthi TaxID=2219224 RepID=UPI00129338D3|nr:hypothetical protein [Nonomuraea phyllanthi]QFY09626.1 hypothetical protein GBF35_25880 [Nonomuraea phyllanthi]